MMTQAFWRHNSASEYVKKTVFTIPLALAMVVTALTFTVSTPAEAASKAKIERRVAKAINEFKEQVKGGEKLLNSAKGVLIFPSVKKAGIGIGGEYGEGALRIGNKTAAYYSTAAASIGLQLGAQARTQFLLFMTSDALNNFRNSEGWEVGVDGSVALVTVGAGGSLDTTNLDAPIIGFIFNNKGLMYNLSLEGSKISEIDR